jgi:hypothetical protein
LGFYIKKTLQKSFFLSKVFKANQIMTKQGFDPKSIKNAIIIITIILLYFVRNLKLTFYSNNVLEL